MKKYIPIDFDEKGKAILGRERNTPTSNGFIPTTWTPGGGGSGEEGNGIESISVSPVLTTTPSFDSITPINYDAEETYKQFTLISTDPKPGEEVTYTITPTAGWKIGYVDDEAPEYGNVGEPFMKSIPCANLYNESGTEIIGWSAIFSFYVANEDESEVFEVYLDVRNETA